MNLYFCIRVEVKETMKFTSGVFLRGGKEGKLEKVLVTCEEMENLSLDGYFYTGCSIQGNRTATNR